MLIQRDLKINVGPPSCLWHVRLPLLLGRFGSRAESLISGQLLDLATDSNGKNCDLDGRLDPGPKEGPVSIFPLNAGIVWLRKFKGPGHGDFQTLAGCCEAFTAGLTVCVPPLPYQSGVCLMIFSGVGCADISPGSADVLIPFHALGRGYGRCVTGGPWSAKNTLPNSRLLNISALNVCAWRIFDIA